jgi:hypothetical protein
MPRIREKSKGTKFKPCEGLQALARSFDCVPHYLFRTTSPRSSGSTSKTYVESNAVKLNLNDDDILSRDRDKAISMLKDHLLWKNQRGDNLVSWTSSLTFAVQHAIRREETDRGPLAPESIELWILDTECYPKACSYPLLLCWRRTR